MATDEGIIFERGGGKVDSFNPADLGRSDEPGNDDNGNRGTDGGYFDASIHAGPDKRNADGSYTLKRGRKPGGSGNHSGGRARRAPKVESSLEGIQGLLIGVHEMLAAVTVSPELTINNGEAVTMSKALKQLADQYDMVIDPKVAAWVNLIGVAGFIYGPRAVMIRERLKDEAKARTAKQPPKPAPNVAPLSVYVPPVSDAEQQKADHANAHPLAGKTMSDADVARGVQNEFGVKPLKLADFGI
jgi:hypothetical protein